MERRAWGEKNGVYQVLDHVLFSILSSRHGQDIINRKIAYIIEKRIKSHYAWQCSR